MGIVNCIQSHLYYTLYTSITFCIWFDRPGLLLITDTYSWSSLKENASVRGLITPVNSTNMSCPSPDNGYSQLILATNKKIVFFFYNIQYIPISTMCNFHHGGGRVALLVSLNPYLWLHRYFHWCRCNWKLQMRYQQKKKRNKVGSIWPLYTCLFCGYFRVLFVAAVRQLSVSSPMLKLIKAIAILIFDDFIRKRMLCFWY